MGIGRIKRAVLTGQVVLDFQPVDLDNVVIVELAGTGTDFLAIQLGGQALILLAETDDEVAIGTFIDLHQFRT